VSWPVRERRVWAVLRELREILAAAGQELPEKARYGSRVCCILRTPHLSFRGHEDDAVAVPR
jgi:hypothetical protein